LRVHHIHAACYIVNRTQNAQKHLPPIQ